MNPVLIDNRAGSVDLIKYKPLDETGELCRLDYGDVLIVGNGATDNVLVGIEVKSIWDLLSSVSTGRLQATQVTGMLEQFDVCWLLYYGEYRPAIRDGRLQVKKGEQWKGFSIGSREVPYGYLEGLLFDLAVLNVHVKHVRDIREAAIWIGCLHRWWSKPWAKHKGMRCFDESVKMNGEVARASIMPRLDDKTLFRARVAKEFPGMGYERAVKAAEYFGSVKEMVNASSDEWVKVDGIGKVIAKAVVKAVE